MEFVLESSELIRLATTDTLLRVYLLKDTDFRIIFVDIPGPLVSASIIVPTVSNNNKGLPHTLEHLVFCGSKSIPFRGYLDNLASRSLSTGTNAYTAEDHTCYEVTTAGSEGMQNLFPIFLDHILHPTLKDSQFMTEVYHVDHKGKHQGVVYCEMASRENTECDLVIIFKKLDFNLRQMVYQMGTTYSYEAGGLIKDIETLTNQEIIDYHRKFYHLNNTTAIICGPVNPQLFLDSLSKYPELFTKSIENYQVVGVDSIHAQRWINPMANLISRTVPFPSDDEEVGSIAYGWRGPPSEDVKTLYALEVLFRYFNDNPSSLFPQKFVERVDPYCTDIDFDIQSHVESPIFLVFSAVPYYGSDQDESDIEDGKSSLSSYSDKDSESGTDEDGSDIDIQSEGDVKTQSRTDLFQEGVFYTLMRETVQKFLYSSMTEIKSIKAALERHRRKMQEGLEDSPHEIATIQLIPDILRYFLSSKSSLLIRSSLQDTRFHNGKPSFGTRLKFTSYMDILDKEPLSYWKSLAQNFLIDSTVCEVMMIPDKHLAKSQTDGIISDEKSRMKSMTKLDILKIEESVKGAIKDNEINLPVELLLKLPPIPDVSKVESMKFVMSNIELAQSPKSLFSHAQIVSSETAFCNIGLVISIAQLPDHLRPYLVLFQELLFQSSVMIDGILMDYKKVSNYVSEIFVSHECGVGFGNSLFSVNYMSQVLTLFVTANPEDWKRTIKFMAEVLLFSQFTKERIITIAKILIANILETKRDGNDVMGAVANRVSLSLETSKELNRNELFISIFTQELFLKNILNEIDVNFPNKNGGEISVIDCLNDIRAYIIQGNDDTASFFRIATPFEFSLDRTTSSTDVDIASDFISIWSAQVANYEAGPVQSAEKYRSGKTSPFPYPRVPFAISQCDSRFSNSVLIPVGGLSTSYLTQFVSCDLLKGVNDTDQFATVLLAEILSRTEGLLYTGIRGKGYLLFIRYAYGASVNCYLWSGQLSFDLYRSSEPQLALMVFYGILAELATDEGVASICSDFEIQTAQASIAYRWASTGATSSSLISSALKSSLQGYKNLDEYRMFVKELYKVDRESLKKVFQKYFSQFLTTQKVTVLTCPQGEATINFKSAFQAGEGQPLSHRIDFTVHGLTDFLL